MLSRLSFDSADGAGRLNFKNFESQWPKLVSENFGPNDYRIIFMILKDESDFITKNDINYFINEMEIRSLDP
jgi:hypothetical protein